MVNYSITKTSNGEYKEVEKKLKLNVSKYVGDVCTLYFDVEGEDNPFLMDYQCFFTIIYDQINKGYLEALSFSDGILKVTSRDGNIIKNYTYDFSLNDFNSLNSSKYDELLRSLYKIVSFYKENPNSSISSEAKYQRLILDIIDGDRMPIIKDKEELLRVFQVYNSSKTRILNALLENALFYDDSGSIVDYKKRLRKQMVNSVKYDVLNQMNAAMAIFAAQNDASDLYQEYMETIYIPRREIVYKYFDEEGNEIEPQEIEGGTIFSLTRNIIGSGLSNLKDLVKTNKNKLLDKADDVMERIRKK